MRFAIHRALSGIPATAWDALHDGRNPFVAHAFLSGLETTGCLREEWGWTPLHVALWDGDALVAAAPGYLKANSHGELCSTTPGRMPTPGTGRITTRNGWARCPTRP